VLTQIKEVDHGPLFFGLRRSMNIISISLLLPVAYFELFLTQC